MDFKKSVVFLEKFWFLIEGLDARTGRTLKNA